MITGLIFQTRAANSSTADGQTEVKLDQNGPVTSDEGEKKELKRKKVRLWLLFQSHHINCVGGHKKERLCLLRSMDIFIIQWV